MNNLNLDFFKKTGEYQMRSHLQFLNDASEDCFNNCVRDASVQDFTKNEMTCLEGCIGKQAQLFESVHKAL